MKKIIETIKKPFKMYNGLIPVMSLLFMTVLSIFLYNVVFQFGNRGFVDVFFVIFLTFIIIIGGSYLASHLFEVLKRIPSGVVFFLVSSFIMLMILFDSNRSKIGNYILIGSIMIFLLTLGFELYGRYYFMRYKRLYIPFKSIRIMNTLGLILSLSVLVYVFFYNGPIDELHANAFETYQTNLELVELDEHYSVIKGVYGNEPYLEKYETDNQEIGGDTSIGSFLSRWGTARERELGYNVYNVPLNGQYFMPNGDGPFPLVLVVHGNHEMTHSSEIGYNYLGEYLAKRGYIVVSVDENFLNFSTFDSKIMQEKLGSENDARGYVLLKHLEMIVEKNKNSDSIFYGKVDANNIALIGHSRGGEAITSAKLFTDINYLPNDGKKRLNTDIEIKSLIAIAPTDGQYKPAGKYVQLKDVNYLLIHGSHDFDVSYMTGGNTYERVAFESGSHFKAQVYIYQANHGQFNEVWHIGDTSPISGLTHTTNQLISRKQQEDTAKQLVSYFLESTLRGNRMYREGFRNVKAFTDLPKNLYLSQYHDETDVVLADFNEDYLLETGINNNVRIVGKSLSTWYENPARLDGKKSQVFGVYIGNNGSNYSYYEIELVEPKALEQDKVFLSLADDDEDNEKLINLEIEVEDSKGTISTIALSEYGMLQHYLEVNLSKFYFLEDVNNRESVFQTFEFPLNKFSNYQDLVDIKFIRIRFPQNENIKVILKDIGLRD